MEECISKSLIDELPSTSDEQPSTMSTSSVSYDPRRRYEQLLEQSALLIEDGITCRDVNHKMRSLGEIRLYRFYNSIVARWARWIPMTILMSLAFFETPNSLTWSPDPRSIAASGGRAKLPVGLTEGIEIVTLLVIGTMALLETWLVGIKSLRRKPWIMFLLISVLISFIDVCIDLSRDEDDSFLRLRRLLRPFIFIQSSSMMKKLLKAVLRTVPEMLSVLLLLAFHLYFFTMIGMLVLQERQRGSGKYVNFTL